MNSQHLLQTFSSAIGWNAFSYTIYKVLFTGLSFLLYHKLSTDYFATWANINSMIYVLLLWVDFGFRKSIARFIPEFYNNTQSLDWFVTRLIVFKIATLICTVPLFFWLAPLLCKTLNLCTDQTFFQLGALVLISYGIASIFKLIYHAHFWQKQFNLLSTTFLIVEMIVNLILLVVVVNPNKLIAGIFITKIISSILTSSIAFFMLKKKYKNFETIKNRAIDTMTLSKGFVKHSTFMWFSTSLKSLTERNVMVPLLTYTLGPAQANLFKVANDGALLFYRSVIKTIGTADTSLLTHVEVQKSVSLSIALKKLLKKMLLLCFLAVSVLMPLLLLFNSYLSKSTAIPLFALLTVCYLLEAILSPYERVLEVKQQYSALFFAYTPYVSVVFVYALTMHTTFLLRYATIKLSFLSLLALIHIARLISSLLMAWRARITLLRTPKNKL